MNRKNKAISVNTFWQKKSDRSNSQSVILIDEDTFERYKSYYYKITCFFIVNSTVVLNAHSIEPAIEIDPSPCSCLWNHLPNRLQNICSTLFCDDNVVDNNLTQWNTVSLRPSLSYSNYWITSDTFEFPLSWLMSFLPSNPCTPSQCWQFTFSAHESLNAIP